MKRIYIDNQLVDIYPNTPIGITLAGTDVTKLEQRKVKYSNSFKLPRTANNEKIFGNAQHPGAVTDLPYDKFRVDYLAGGIYLIENGRAYLSNVDAENFSISMYDDGLDIVKSFQELTLQYVFNTKAASGDSISVRKTDNSPVTSYEDVFRVLPNREPSFPIVNSYKSGLIFNYDYDNHISTDALAFAYTKVFVTVHHVIDFLEDYFDLTIDGDFKDLSVYDTLSFLLNARFAKWGGDVRIEKYTTSTGVQAENWINPELTAWDLVKALAQMFNCNIEFGKDSITLTQIDSIEDSEIVDWSDKLIKYRQRFRFGDYAQNNYIKWKVDEGVNSDYNAVNVVSNNKNINESKTVYTINSLAPVYLDLPFFTDDCYYFHSDDEAASADEYFQFMYFTGNTPGNYIVQETDGDSSDAFSNTILIPETLNISSNFTVLSKILSNTKVYDAYMNLNEVDILQFKQSKRYAIQALGEAFFVNGIKSWNPDDKRGAKVELVKIT